MAKPSDYIPFRSLSNIKKETEDMKTGSTTYVASIRGAQIKPQIIEETIPVVEEPKQEVEVVVEQKTNSEE